MLEAAKSGILEDVYYEPDLSVVIQQVFSIIYSPRAITLEFLCKLFDDFCPIDELKAILENLVENEWLV